MRRVLRRATLVLLAGLALWVLGTAASVYAFGRVDQTAPADAAIVLGAAVYREQPSPVFRERINHAISLYQSGTVPALIFTGGIGRNDDQAESEAARDYALEVGVPEGDIYIETTSTDTYGNLQGAQAIMGLHGFDTALIVSDPLHMQRAMSMAEDLGLEAHSSPTPTSRYVSLRSQLWFLARETLFNMSYALFSAG